MINRGFSARPKIANDYNETYSAMGNELGNPNGIKGQRPLFLLLSFQENPQN